MKTLTLCQCPLLVGEMLRRAERRALRRGRWARLRRDPEVRRLVGLLHLLALVILTLAVLASGGAEWLARLP